MTKQEYIKNHPRSYLTKALLNNNWPSKTPIELTSGTVSPDHPRSNLCHALMRSKRNQFVVGGRAGINKNDGYHMAVA